jgi:putative ABC transport system permease protein
MDWKEHIAQAIEELWHHKTRTMLTLLGMIFGVGAVIAMLSIGEGAEREAMKLIDSMGLKSVIVKAKDYDQDALKEIRKHSSGLTMQDAMQARLSLPFIDVVAIEKDIEVFSLFSHKNPADVGVKGVSTNYFDLAGIDFKSGNMFSEQHNQGFAQVAVVGAQAAKHLFGQDNPIGQYVKVNHLWLEVIGVLEPKHMKKNEFQGIKLENENNRIYLPIRTALKRFAFKPMANEVDAIKFKLAEDVDPVQGAKGVSRYMDARHHGMDDYDLIIPAALMEQQRQTQRIFTIVMACVAGISLLVGGIGIMNIMLATILERTKEIGLRRAIGATQKDIQQQFMFESFTISAIGAVMGIIFGFVLAGLLSAFSGWEVAWNPLSVLLSVSVCSLIGMLFGIYPAVKASQLDPIEALHSD